MGKSVAKLGRDIKHWPVWAATKERVDAFKRTMPLIADLRNPAMRPRHWKQLMDTIAVRNQHFVAVLCVAKFSLPKWLSLKTCT